MVRPQAGAQSARPDTVAFDVEPNLKTFIELGRPLPQAPWEMPGRR